MPTTDIEKDIRWGFSAKLRGNLSIAGAVILIPFMVKNIIVGHYMLVALNVVLISVLLASAWSLHRTGESIWRGGLVLAMAVAAVYWSVYEVGHFGIYWGFPVVLLFHIVLNRKQALVGSGFYIAGMVALSWLTLGFADAIRVLGTMVLASWFAFVFAARHAKQQRKLERLVRIDPLTGAYNRRHFEDSIEESIANKQRYERPISLVLFDIDHFKTINDQHGHKAGDEVLCWVVQVVTERIRKADVLFRYGGDEFVILMPQTDLHLAGKVANDIKALIGGEDTPFEFRLSLSIGVAELCRDESSEHWVKRADQALYDAKGQGRDHVTISPSTVAI